MLTTRKNVSIDMLAEYVVVEVDPPANTNPFIALSYVIPVGENVFMPVLSVIAVTLDPVNVKARVSAASSHNAKPGTAAGVNTGCAYIPLLFIVKIPFTASAV